MDGSFYNAALSYAVFVRTHYLFRDGCIQSVRRGERRWNAGDSGAFCHGCKIVAACKGDLLHVIICGNFGTILLAFAITISVADVLIGAPYFLNWEWLVCVILFMPVIALFSVVFVSWEFTRVYSTGETIQTMGYLMLPLLILYLIQFTGVFHITVPLLLGITVVLAILSVVLFNAASRHFQPDTLFCFTNRKITPSDSAKLFMFESLTEGRSEISLTILRNLIDYLISKES